MDTSTIVTIILAGVVWLATGAVAWGAANARMKQVEHDVLEMRQNHETFKEKVVMEKTCLGNHNRSDKVIDEMKDMVWAISEKLDQLLMRSK